MKLQVLLSIELVVLLLILGGHIQNDGHPIQKRVAYDGQIIIPLFFSLLHDKNGQTLSKITLII
ncbi:hypothetical protein H6768_06335 [Candidatus Peribacteria bacterium]|nr:hypothetical protein [Candidatus Peribacteria bacterium]